MAKLQMLKTGLPVLDTRRVQTVQIDSWRSGMTSTQRGYGYKWQKAREGYLRSHPLCVMCEAQGRVTVATVVDHIKPHRGDRALFWDSKNNWQSLCATHHSADKQREEARQKAGTLGHLNPGWSQP